MTVPFKKADPKQAALKVSIYGEPGSGKTFTSLLFAEGIAAMLDKRVAMVDTERGSDFYALPVKRRQVHPKAFDFDALYTRSLAEVMAEVKALDPKVHGVVILDSITHLWSSAMDSYKGKKTKVDSIPMHAWGKIKKPYKDLLQYLIDSPFHVFILGRQKNLFETDEQSGEMKKTGVAMRAEGETPYEPHICLRMQGILDQASRRTTYMAHVEKDRSGLLAGQLIENPNFKTIAPLLGLLGTEQGATDNEEERLAADGELMAESKSAAAKKAEKSRKIFEEAQPGLALVSNLEELGAIKEGLRKKWRYLTDEHKGALGILVESAQVRVVEAATGDDL